MFKLALANGDAALISIAGADAADLVTTARIPATANADR
jgi:hypothetical protein